MNKNKNSLKILIDTGHPAHIHFFIPVIKQLENKGHTCLLSIREKECSAQIANAHDLNYVSKGKGSYSLLFKPLFLIRAVVKIYRSAKKFKPDILLSFASPYAAIVAGILNKPHIVIDDTEQDTIVQWIYKRFSSDIITPACFMKDFGVKHIRADAYKELAYLNPANFAADTHFKKRLGFDNNEDYILIRLVNHGAMHDMFSGKWDAKSKFDFIKKLAEAYPVIISSEVPLPARLEQYRFKLPETEFHQAIANAKLVVGESATVATESAVLGVPAIFIDYNTRGYIVEIENKYRLVKHFKPAPDELKKAEDLVHDVMRSSAGKEYQHNRQKLLSEKIDIAAFMVWFVGNYPESGRVMRDDAGYQYRFGFKDGRGVRERESGRAGDGET